ncbi:unnamed protein product, partial [Symbiodinium necroappetens]
MEISESLQSVASRRGTTRHAAKPPSSLAASSLEMSLVSLERLPQTPAVRRLCPATIATPLTIGQIAASFSAGWLVAGWRPWQHVLMHRESEAQEVRVPVRKDQSCHGDAVGFGSDVGVRGPLKFRLNAARYAVPFDPLLLSVHDSGSGKKGAGQAEGSFVAVNWQKSWYTILDGICTFVLAYQLRNEFVAPNSELIFMQMETPLPGSRVRFT